MRKVVKKFKKAGLLLNIQKTETSFNLKSELAEYRLKKRSKPIINYIIMNIKFILSLVVFSFLFSSCGPALPAGQKAVDLPCFQDRYTSNSKNYIASGRGISVDQVTSRKKALMNAKSEIASLIRTNIKVLTDDYSLSRNVNNQEQFKSRFESITSESVQEMLTDIVVSCQQLAFDKKSGQYNTYIALSINKDNTAAQIVDRLSDKEKKELDIDYDKFRLLLDKEIPTKN